MDEWTLSEVCYENGFHDGRLSPIYIAIGPLGVIKTMTLGHFKEKLRFLSLMVLFLTYMNIYPILGKNLIWLAIMFGL